MAESPSGDSVEALARAAYIEFDFPAAVERWERAYALHRQAGNHVGAIRVARTLGYLYATAIGDMAVSRGWTARAQTLLGEAADTPEAGWVALNVGMWEPDRATKNERFRLALAAARRTGDTDLECAALAYLGASLVHGDEVDEGMLLLDEALGGGGGRRGRRLLRRRGDLLSAVLRLRARARRRPGRPVDPGRGGDRGPAEPSGRVRLLPHPLRRAADRGRAVARSRRGPQRGRAALGPRASRRSLRRRARPPGRAARAAGTFRGGGAAPRRPATATWRRRGRWPPYNSPRGRHRRRRGHARRALGQIDPPSAAAAPLLALLVDVHLATGALVEAEAAALQLATLRGPHPEATT